MKIVVKDVTNNVTSAVIMSKLGFLEGHFVNSDLESDQVYNSREMPFACHIRHVLRIRDRCDQELICL